MRLYQDNRRNQNSLCQKPCVFTNMFFGPPVIGPSDQNLGELILYFRNSIKVVHQYHIFVIREAFNKKNHFLIDIKQGGGLERASSIKKTIAKIP